MEDLRQSGNTRLRVLIADDHPPTRKGVRLALEQGNFQVCAECGDAESAVERALASRPHICLLDIRMPGNGLSAIRRIRGALPATVVVMLTVSTDSDDLRQAIEAGAAGYLLKDLDIRRLPLILRRVADGEMALPRSLTGQLVDGLLDQHRRRRLLAADGTVTLTRRETEILELVHGGRSTGEIAGALGISPATVRSHVSRTLRKLRAEDRTAAAGMLDDALIRLRAEAAPAGTQEA